MWREGKAEVGSAGNEMTPDATTRSEPRQGGEMRRAIADVRSEVASLVLQDPSYYELEDLGLRLVEMTHLVDSLAGVLSTHVQTLQRRAILGPLTTSTEAGQLLTADAELQRVREALGWVRVAVDRYRNALGPDGKFGPGARPGADTGIPPPRGRSDGPGRRDG